MPPRKLTDEQFAEVLDEFREEAKRFRKPPNELFTTAAISQRLEERFGVKYNKGNVWRRMANNGWKFLRSPRTHEERMAALRERRKR